MTNDAGLSPRAAAAAAAVDAAALREDLATIVRIPSVTGSEEAVSSDLARRLAAEHD